MTWLVAFLLTNALAAPASSPARGADDPLEEAQGLPDEPASAPPLMPAARGWKARSYISLLGIEERRGSELVRTSAPELEWGNTVQKTLVNGADAFADFNLYSRDREGTAYLNQFGVRGAAGSFAYALGKERNRRTPGFFVSPSDFLFAQTALPGQREDRVGIWLARASWQSDRASIDGFYLAGDHLDRSGWLRADQDPGAAVRALFKVGEGDANVLIGHRAGQDRAGVSLEDFVAKVWKVYLEVGAKRVSENLAAPIERPVAGLAGLSYEGSEDFSWRIEYFQQQDPGLTPPFLREKYVLATLQFPEVRDRFNFFVSGIASAEDDGRLFVGRGEWLSGPHSLWGLTWVEIAGDEDSQYFRRAFDRQWLAEYKYTF